MVDLPGGVVALFPPPDGTELCPDPTLRISFSGAPRLGSGSIEVRQSGSSTAVASVDVGSSRWSDTIGGVEFSLGAPVEIEGNTVVVQLPSRGLELGQSYEVVVASGAIMGPSGAVSIAAGSWKFTTRAAAPSDLASVVVARDGSGDFCSVQGAIDAVPDDATSQRVIQIGQGIYRGIIHFERKNKLTLRGDDRKGTVLQGINNENQNGGTAKRALVGIDSTQDLIIENLTVHNLTPQGGSQAEALRLQRCERCVVRDVDVKSLQDTLLWSGTIYARNCYIEGNVDYIWGTGTAFFDQCEIKTVGRKGYNLQARNDASTYGYVFVKSRLTSDSGITGDILARVDTSVYPASHVAYIDCEMGPHIAPEGWMVTGGGTGSVRYWEYKSVKPDGSPVDTSRRLSGSKQLSDAEAAMMRDPSVVLAGWMPPQ